MSKKKILITVAAICLVIAVGAVLIITSGKERGKSAQDTETSAEKVAENAEDTDSQSEDSQAGKEDVPSQTEAADEGESKEETVEQDSEKDTEGTGESASAGESTGSSTSQNVANSQESESGGEQLAEENTTVSFPYEVEGTSLTIENISSYDGIFLEDGSDQEVSGITAMVLKNTGDVNVEYTSITLKRDGEELQFEASDIPAGATVVVQEKNKAAYGSGTFTDCSGIAAELDSFEMSEDQVKVEETEGGALQVTNLTDSEIPCIRIFYKFYMADQQSYVGGITYTAKLTNVAGGSSQTVTPSHYVAGSSQVLMVRTYDTAE